MLTTEDTEAATPETDAETMRDEYDHVDSDFGPFAPSDTVSADFARKLERERDKAREDATNYYARIGELEKERDEAIADRDILRIDAQREAEHHDRMVGELERVYKERDEARERAAKWESSFDAMERALRAERERDEARESLAMARKALEGWE